MGSVGLSGEGVRGGGRVQWGRLLPQPRGCLAPWWGLGQSEAGRQEQGTQTPLPSPAGSWAGRWCSGRRCCAGLGALALLAGASIGSWLLGQCWDPSVLGEGQRTGSGDPCGKRQADVKGSQDPSFSPTLN